MGTKGKNKSNIGNRKQPKKGGEERKLLSKTYLLDASEAISAWERWMRFSSLVSSL